MVKKKVTPDFYTKIRVLLGLKRDLLVRTIHSDYNFVSPDKSEPQLNIERIMSDFFSLPVMTFFSICKRNVPF